MKAAEERGAHEARETELAKDLEAWKKRNGRRVPPAPARDDRGETKPWRPGLRVVALVVLVAATSGCIPLMCWVAPSPMMCPGKR